MYCGTDMLELDADISDLLDEPNYNLDAASATCNSTTYSRNPVKGVDISKPDSLHMHTAPMYNKRSQVTARDDHTAIMCGCRGHFFWELISSKNINFFRGTAPDSVDHCVCSVFTFKTFSEAFWDAYGHCVTHPRDIFFSSYVRDWSLAVYQMHDSTTCPKYQTRYTLGSIKSYIQYNEQLRMYPVIGSFCKCRCDLLPENIAYNVCFTCLQCVLELNALSLVGVKEHFSFEVVFKDGFLSALLPKARNDKVYFTAQALFEKGISITSVITGGCAYLNLWKLKNQKWRTLSKQIPNNSFCILCHQSGNGFGPFMCTSCSEHKMKM